MRIGVGGREFVYLDVAATMPMTGRAARALQEAAERWPGNPSSLHALGREAAAHWEKIQAGFLTALGLDPGTWRVVFTSGGTEADALAVLGPTTWRSGGSVVLSEAEHPAVLGCRRLLERAGLQVLTVPAGRDGLVDPGRVAATVRSDTRLVSVLTVQNEIGTLQDVASVARACRRVKPDVLVHTDAVQALGHVDLGALAAHVDLMSLSAHKIGGPRGCGALLVRRNVSMEPLTGGGGQQMGIRPGTEDLPSAHAFLAALEDALAWNRDHFRALHGMFRRLVSERLPRVRILGDTQRVSGHILALAVPGIGSEVLVRGLSERGVCVSAGSACRTRARARSPVLGAMGVPKSWGVVRFSWGPTSTEADIEEAIEQLVRVVQAYAIDW